MLWNTKVTEYTLTSKSIILAYNYVSQGFSTNEWRTDNVKNNANPEDIMTKTIISGINRYQKVHMVMYNIYLEGKQQRA